MKEFFAKHPFLTVVAISIVCGTVYNCIRVIKDPESAKISPINLVVNKKGDEKGA